MRRACRSSAQKRTCSICDSALHPPRPRPDFRAHRRALGSDGSARFGYDDTHHVTAFEKLPAKRFGIPRCANRRNDLRGFVLRSEFDADCTGETTRHPGRCGWATWCCSRSALAANARSTGGCKIAQPACARACHRHRRQYPRSTLRRAKPQLKLARCRTRASALTGHGCIPWPTGYFHPADSCGRKPGKQLSTGTDASPRRIR